MNAEVESDALHARVRALVRSFDRGEPMPESFDAIAADVARFQAAFVPGYGRLCAAHRLDPASIVLASQAPAVPTDAFRVAHVFAFASGDATATFRTSGTTHCGHGVHNMRTTVTYDAAALAFGRAMLARDLARPSKIFVLTAPPGETPESSLAHMCALFASALGEPAPPDLTFFVRSGKLDVGGLRRRIEDTPRSTPVVVLATSFALVHLLDDLAGSAMPLPPFSRVMQTGGFKGKSREVSAGELRTAVARAFGIEERAVIAEYGMTELSSQFWEATLVDPHARHGLYVEPPWARVIAVNPDTLAPLAHGAVGIGRIEDLANVDSAFAVLTQDLVRCVEGGFEVIGRAIGAPARGCSIALDEILSGDERS